MSNAEKPGGNEIGQLLHSVGVLTGTVKAMHEGLAQRIDDIRADVRRLENDQSRRIERVEQAMSEQVRDIKDTIGKRLDGLEERVANLEAEDKSLIEKTAKVSAISSGIGGALIAGVVELIKRAGT